LNQVSSIGSNSRFANVKNQKQVSFGVYDQISEIPKDLKYARKAIQSLCPELEPIRTVASQVSDTVIRGRGFRTAAVIGSLYHPKTIVHPLIQDAFISKERQLIQGGGSINAIQALRENYFGMVSAISQYGKVLSTIKWPHK